MEYDLFLLLALVFALVSVLFVYLVSTHADGSEKE